MCDSRLSRHRTNTACTVEAAIDSREAIANGDRRWRIATPRSARTTASGVRFGLRCGRLPAIGHTGRAHRRIRPAQRFAVRPRHVKVFSGTCDRPTLINDTAASNNRPRGVRTALAWTRRSPVCAVKWLAAPLHDGRPSPSTTATACRHTSSTTCLGSTTSPGRLRSAAAMMIWSQAGVGVKE